MNDFRHAYIPVPGVVWVRDDDPDKIPCAICMMSKARHDRVQDRLRQPMPVAHGDPWGSLGEWMGEPGAWHTREVAERWMLLLPVELT